MIFITLGFIDRQKDSQEDPTWQTLKSSLLAMSVGHRLCIDFCISKVNFLIIFILFYFLAQMKQYFIAEKNR